MDRARETDHGPTSQDAPPVVALMLRLEQATALDPVVRAVQPVVRAAVGRGRRAVLLRGVPVGHALHPVLTDVVIGSWVSASVLDLLRGRESQPAARTLVGVGVVAAVPTAVTGWAEWSATEVRDQRVGLVHAAANGVAVLTYTASWVARRRGAHGVGAGLALAGAVASGAGAYLGGHLSAARDVGSHHPAFTDAPATT